MGIKKAEIPNIERASGNLKDIQEFIDSGWDGAEVELDGRKAKAVYVSLRSAIMRRGIEGVKVMMRGGRVFLKRTDKRARLGDA